MAKNIKKLMAMTLVVCMLVSALPLQALAAEGDGVEHSTEKSPEGFTTNVTTTQTTTTNENGDKTVTVTIEKDTSGVKANGSEVERTESKTTETTTNADGKVIEKSTVNEGKETVKESVSVENVTVAVPEEAGDKNTGYDGEASVSAPTGDVKDGEDDEVYNQTTVTTTPGSVTITTTEKTLTETTETEKTDMEYVKSETNPDGTNDLVYAGQAPEEFLPGYEGEAVIPEGVDDYDYVYVGSGNTSKFVPAILFDEPLTNEQKLEQFGDGAYIKKNSITYYYVKWLKQEDKDRIAYDEKGGYVTDEEGYILDVDGNRIFKEERTEVGPNGETTYLHRFDNYNNGLFVEGWYDNGEWVEDLNGDKSFGAIWAGPQQFVLVDNEGNIITTYCADFTTPTQDTFGYNVENLEDATYYSEEEALRIRSIALNGYWGTVGNKTDANGKEILDENGNPIPKVGSLEAMKAAMLASGQFTEEELAALNDGVALTATQMAIWSNSNKMTGLDFINAHYSNWGVGNVPEEKEAEVKMLFKVYDYLMALTPTEVAGTTADTIINSDNFIKDMAVTVVKKADDHENNKDADKTNDAYVTDLSFALVVQPATDENGNPTDDLKVTVQTANGQKFVGRISGEKQEGEMDLDRDENGNYWFRNIVLTEGDQTFTLNLEGIQNLKEGVYLYSSEVREDTSSQTLVGLASGDRGFNVTMDITFDLDVEEGVVAKERVWRNNGKKRTPEDPNNPPNTPWNPPEVHRLANDGIEIPEEPVPLATPVITGDSTGVWVALFLMVAFGMVALNLFDKKRKNETF